MLSSLQNSQRILQECQRNIVIHTKEFLEKIKAKKPIVQEITDYLNSTETTSTTGSIRVIKKNKIAINLLITLILEDNKEFQDAAVNILLHENKNIEIFIPELEKFYKKIALDQKEQNKKIKVILAISSLYAKLVEKKENLKLDVFFNDLNDSYKLIDLKEISPEFFVKLLPFLVNKHVTLEGAFKPDEFTYNFLQNYLGKLKQKRFEAVKKLIRLIENSTKDSIEVAISKLAIMLGFTNIFPEKVKSHKEEIDKWLETILAKNTEGDKKYLVLINAYGEAISASLKKANQKTSSFSLIPPNKKINETIETMQYWSSDAKQTWKGLPSVEYWHNQWQPLSEKNQLTQQIGAFWRDGNNVNDRLEALMKLSLTCDFYLKQSLEDSKEKELLQKIRSIASEHLALVLRNPKIIDNGINKDIFLIITARFKNLGFGYQPYASKHMDEAIIEIYKEIFAACLKIDVNQVPWNNAAEILLNLETALQAHDPNYFAIYQDSLNKLFGNNLTDEQMKILSNKELLNWGLIDKPTYYNIVLEKARKSLINNNLLMVEKKRLVKEVLYKLINKIKEKEQVNITEIDVGVVVQLERILSFYDDQKFASLYTDKLELIKFDKILDGFKDFKFDKFDESFNLLWKKIEETICRNYITTNFLEENLRVLDIFKNEKIIDDGNIEKIKENIRRIKAAIDGSKFDNFDKFFNDFRGLANVISLNVNFLKNDIGSIDDFKDGLLKEYIKSKQKEEKLNDIFFKMYMREMNINSMKHSLIADNENIKQILKNMLLKFFQNDPSKSIVNIVSWIQEIKDRPDLVMFSDLERIPTIVKLCKDLLINKSITVRDYKIQKELEEYHSSKDENADFGEAVYYDRLNLDLMPTQNNSFEAKNDATPIQCFFKNGDLVYLQATNEGVQIVSLGTSKILSHQKLGWGLYIVSMEGWLYVITHKNLPFSERQKIRHSSAIAGSLAEAAGEFNFNFIKAIMKLTIYTGHYKMHIEDLNRLFDLLINVYKLKIDNFKIYISDERYVELFTEVIEELKHINIKELFHFGEIDEKKVSKELNKIFNYKIEKIDQFSIDKRSFLKNSFSKFIANKLKRFDISNKKELSAFFAMLPRIFEQSIDSCHMLEFNNFEQIKHKTDNLIFILKNEMEKLLQVLKILFFRLNASSFLESVILKMEDYLKKVAVFDDDYGNEKYINRVNDFLNFDFFPLKNNMLAEFSKEPIVRSLIDHTLRNLHYINFVDVMPNFVPESLFVAKFKKDFDNKWENLNALFQQNFPGFPIQSSRNCWSVKKLKELINSYQRDFLDKDDEFIFRKYMANLNVEFGDRDKATIVSYKKKIASILAELSKNPLTLNPYADKTAEKLRFFTFAALYEFSETSQSIKEDTLVNKMKEILCKQENYTFEEIAKKLNDFLKNKNDSYLAAYLGQSLAGCYPFDFATLSNIQNLHLVTPETLLKRNGVTVKKASSENNTRFYDTYNTFKITQDDIPSEDSEEIELLDSGKAEEKSLQHS